MSPADDDTPPDTLSAPLLVRRMGHDFNNLLSIVLGGLRLLREELPASAWSPELEEVYDDVLSATREAADVITQLTAWAGRQTLEPRDCDLREVAREIAPLLERALPAGVTVSLEDPGVPVLAHVDASRLQAAVMELAANARDAMPGVGRLLLAAEFDADGAPCLAVSDDGEGMGADVLARCVEPYFTTRANGTRRGTGLSVVDGFARASGGRLRMASEPGAGTRATMCFTAPRAQAANEGPASPGTR